MSHNNPNFPQQPFTRASAGRPIDDPGAGWGNRQQAPGGMPTMGMPAMSGGQGMPTMGGQQRPVSQAAQFESISRQIGLNNDYGTTNQSNNDYSAVTDFINGGREGTDADMVALKTEEAKNSVFPLAIHVMTEFQHRSGRYAAFDVSINEFSMKFTAPVQCQTILKFRDLINNSMKFRQNIGLNVGTLLGHQIADAIIKDQQIDQRQTQSWYMGCLDNIIALELIKWLSANQAARNDLMAEGLVGDTMRRRLMEQFHARITHVNDSFNFMGIQSPYEAMEPKLDNAFDVTANPSHYVMDARRSSHPTMNYGDVSSNMSGQTLSDEEYRAYCLHLSEQDAMSYAKQYGQRSQEVSYQPDFSNSAEEPLNFGESNAAPTDLSQMTTTNHQEYDWMSHLVPLPKCDLWTADNETVNYLRNTFFAGRFDRLRTADGSLTVFTLDKEGKPGEDDRIINLHGRSMETFLTNPSLLLPLLEETPEGIVEVTEVKLTVDENEQYDLAALKEAAIGTKNVRNTLIEDFTSTDLEAFDREAGYIHNAGRRQDVVHATTNVETHYQSVVVSSPSQVGEVYRTLSMLVKGETQAINYFDWIRSTYGALCKHHIEEVELIGMADSYIRLELERHMVERYGYSNDASHQRSFTVDTLADCFNDIEGYIRDLCPEAWEELSTVKGSQALISKSQCLMPRNEGLLVMGANVRAKSRIKNLEDYNISIRLCFARQVIVTRISNMAPPVSSSEETIAVMKRSENPDFFSVIAVAYAKASARLLDGAEQLVIFTDASEARWSFQTNRYDGSNVGTIRRLKRYETNLTILPLEMTHRL